MARNLYRFYLYIIFIALIVFAVYVTAQLLGTLFEFTALRGSYDSVPAQAALIQALVFAIIGWIVSGALGGLHYWLIRRDQSSDPTAGQSGIRSFFLNITEAVGVVVTVSLAGFGVLETWANYYGGSVAYSLGAVLPTLGMVLLLELERRRFPVQKGAALVFQRIHLFGVQVFLLSFLTSVFLNDFRSLANILFFGGQNRCTPDYGYCPTYQLAGLLSSLLWFSACWLIYSLRTGGDTSRLVRMILHGASFAFAWGWTLYGVFVVLRVLLSPLFHISLTARDIVGFTASYDFFSPLALGILTTVIYHLLLRNLWRRDLIERATLLLSEGAIATILLAATFWSGGGFLLYNLLQTLAPSPAVPQNQDWVIALALLITGLAYIPLDLLIRQRFLRDPDHALGPRRGFVLALLAGGILTLAIGGVIALYSWGTALLGSPLTNWPRIAHGGLAAAIVGVALLGLYLWPLRGEHLLTRPGKPVEPTPPVVPPTQAPSQTIEEILDELLAGHISRDEAAARLRALHDLSMPVPHP